ncbi:MAG: germination protein YpeB [Faecalibacterium sp.]|nr:germination protein YpeB [Ruminococcus sp.]MCM1392563.1 germination protein YpeB [Ruminococcus sp.]MCM1485638.1 germination protein YpeB [Faecalibacterium sp.]
MKNNFSKRSYIKVISFLSFVSILLCAATIVSTVKAEQYRTLSSASSERAISELCEDLDSITVALQKGMYSNSKPMLSQVGTELYRSSACAKVNLSQLTDENMITDEIYKFLSQVGDFTLSLSRKLESGKQMTESERNTLRKLYEYSASLSDGIGELRDGYYDGTVSFEKNISTLSLDGSEEASFFTDSVNDAEQSLTDYPTLIYDGPFADSVLNKKSNFLTDKKEITEKEAKEKVAKILGADISQLRQDSDENSTLSLYCFSVGEKSIAITKNGGYLCYMTNPDYSGKSVISEKEATKRGKEFLEKIGFDDMNESYYSTYDGICTVNYAYKNDEIIYYADLIKVSVALDSGTVVAVDARGYLTNHCNRSLPDRKVSLKQAKSNLATELTVISTATAMIPTDYGKEKLCYELHCRDSKKQEVLIYIDVETGTEADILLLLYSDDGVLTR